jgi:hypothetical protein
MKKFSRLLGLFMGAVLVLPSIASAAPATKFDGRFLIQTQNGGKLWYVSPVDHLRHAVTLDDGSTDWFLYTNIVTIESSDLKKFPLAKVLPKATGADKSLDTDNDGLPDSVEKMLGTDPAVADTDKDGFNDKTEIVGGYDPFGSGKVSADKKLLAVYGGMVVHASDDEFAWYINKTDGRRYVFATDLIAKMALGISNANLIKIPQVVAVTGSQKGKIVDCGDDIDCFIKLTANCLPARMKYHATLLGMSSDNTDEVVGTQGLDDCRIDKLAANQNLFISKTLSAEQKEAAIKQMDYIKNGGYNNLSCVGPTEKFVNSYTDAKKGEFAFSASISLSVKDGQAVSTEAPTDIICTVKK